VIIVAKVVICSVVGFTIYMWGYRRGYCDGLDYGKKALEDYHQHTMQAMRSFGDNLP
jgi:hypothetical protein